MSELRVLPSVEKILQSVAGRNLVDQYGRGLCLFAIRSTLDEVRLNYSRNRDLPNMREIIECARETLERKLNPSMVSVINATGVIIHTNLGRAPLSRSAIKAMSDVAAAYSNLEYDLEKGQRGSRSVHAEELLRVITGADSALVVNNNAAGVLLVLSALARGKRVIISRSQLIEIGGGFRVPEVMKQSGVKLVEIGTTNRVHLEDYEEALKTPAGAVLRAHSSNFRLIGFTTEPRLQDVVAVAHRYNVPFIDDLGSGALIDTANYGLAHEPTVKESIRAGADVNCFSGDKLIGGPQAGIIVGRADLLAKIKKHPWARAVRADKLCLAGLSATLMHYLKGDYEENIPVWKMISTSAEALMKRATAWRRVIGFGEVIPAESTIGGGSLPGETLPTYLLSLPDKSPDGLLKRLRQSKPPVIARILDDQVVLDPRTVMPEQEEMMLSILRSATSEY